MNSPEFPDRSDEELLRVVLQSDKRALELIKKVPLETIDQAHRNELGITPKAFERLQASIELGRRIQERKTEYKKITKIGSSQDAIEFCKKHFRRLILEGLQEEFHTINLDTKNQIIDTVLITRGTLDASLVHPREVFRPAIKRAASSIILVHNHPSGDPTASREDVAVTNRITGVGETMGIDVLDHIVVAKDGCVSIRESE